MRRNTWPLLALVLTFVLTLATPSFSRMRSPYGSDSAPLGVPGATDVVWNPRTGAASFIRIDPAAPALSGPAPLAPAAAALGFVERYAAALGVSNPAEEVYVAGEETDRLGLHHVKLQQHYQGVDVYNAAIKVHLGSDQQLVAISSGFIPGVAVPTTRPAYDAAYAQRAAGRALPAGRLLAAPALVIYPRSRDIALDRLAWLVELRDDSVPARQRYVIDALDGSFVDALDLLNTDRDRKTYSAEGNIFLPGTLKRSESDGPTGDADVDAAHDFSGRTYDYYLNTHSRDSYDNAGATLISTAHYGTNFQNAFWNGEQMVYGDGFVIDDVVAHELTHAVTSKTANLEYRWQSGALNESISDIFGAMVDRDDWVIGEDLPDDVLGGQEAIRDMADPARFNQPAHTDAWVKTCADQEGVHINSGIPNKAYYNIATAIGKDKAAQIFYRTLTVYLHETSSLEDARAGALQAAADLYGASGAEYAGVNSGFEAVGLNGTWSAPENSCTCAATTVLADRSLYADPLAVMNIAATLYRVREHVLNTTPTGLHYRSLYEAHTGRISQLLLLDGSLREAAARVLGLVVPGLDGLSSGEGQAATVTAETVAALDAFLQQLAAADRAHGGDSLARAIERERADLDLNQLIGMTYQEAWDYINSRPAQLDAVYLPIVAR